MQSMNKQIAAMRKFDEQRAGIRTPHKGTDDGELSFAVSSDDARGLIVIRFAKPVEWIGLSPQDASMLAHELTRRAGGIISAAAAPDPAR